MDAEALQRELLFLRRRVSRLLSLLHLVVVAIRVLDFSFDRVRIPEGARKQRLLRAIERTRTHLPLRDVLKLIGMSSTRYHAWLGKQECGLDDLSCCPKSELPQFSWARGDGCMGQSICVMQYALEDLPSSEPVVGHSFEL